MAENYEKKHAEMHIKGQFSGPENMCLGCVSKVPLQG